MIKITIESRLRIVKAEGTSAQTLFTLCVKLDIVWNGLYSKLHAVKNIKQIYSSPNLISTIRSAIVSLGESRETDQPVSDFGGRHLPLPVRLFCLAWEPAPYVPTFLLLGITLHESSACGTFFFLPFPWRGGLKEDGLYSSPQVHDYSYSLWPKILLCFALDAARRRGGTMDPFRDSSMVQSGLSCRFCVFCSSLFVRFCSLTFVALLTRAALFLQHWFPLPDKLLLAGVWLG